MIVLMIAVAVLTVLMLMAVPLWQTEMQREAEAELIFRARQYVNAIGFYVKAHNNLFPQNFEILHLEKFLRQLYPDPLGPEGRWDMVFQETSGGEAKFLVVPAHMAKAYFGRAVLVGVCSTSAGNGFPRIPRQKQIQRMGLLPGGKGKRENARTAI